MICPFCHNGGYKAADGRPDNPVVNLGGKEVYRTGAIRRYTCLNCGRYFRTTETYLDEVQPKKDQLELFAVKRQLEIGLDGGR